MPGRRSSARQSRRPDLDRHRGRAGRIPARVPRPRLLNVWEWADDAAAYRAELTCYVTSRVCSATPTLRENLDLPGSWWASLRDSLTALAEVPTDGPVLLDWEGWGLAPAWPVPHPRGWSARVRRGP